LIETDARTGLSDPRQLSRVLGNLPARTRGREPISVMRIDIDQRDGVDDVHGPALEDQILPAVVETLRGSLSAGDTACRWGEEGFLVIRPSTALADAVSWSERLREKVAALRITHDGRAVPVTVSIGVVTRASDGIGDEAILASGQALSLAKRSGQNRVRTSEMALFAETVARPEVARGSSAEERLGTVLEVSRERLGPTQRDHLTSHSEYVSQFSTWIAPLVGLGPESVSHVRVAGLLHDIGKFAIPEAVLAKQTPLTGAERALICRHTRDGTEMSLWLGADPAAADYIHHHHTPFDGRGCVSGTRGEAIPLGGRILNVADAFVSMTSHRPYRSARSFTAAVRELQRCCGTQFDPAVVEAVPRALLARAPGFVH